MNAIRGQRFVATGFWLFAVFFSLQWAASQALFPLYKGRLIGYAPIASGLVLGAVLYSTRFRALLTAHLMTPPRWLFLLLLALGAMALRLTAVALIPLDPIGDPALYHGYALNLLAGNGYGGDGHRAHYPPGMSFLLAGWYAVTTPEVGAGKLLSTLLGVILVLVTYDLGRRVHNEATGRWAAILTTIMPTLIVFSATVNYELSLACIFVTVADLSLVLAHTRRVLPSLAIVCAIGLLLGAGTLIKPICLLVPILLLISWSLQMPISRAITGATVCGSLIILVIIPWTLRNQRVFGEFVLISTNGGVVLYNANNPASNGSYMKPDPLAGEDGEVSRDRIRGRAAIQWIISNPGRWLELAVAKCVMTWGTSSSIVSFISQDRLPIRQEQAWIGLINMYWAAMLVCFAVATWRGRLLNSVAFAVPLLLLAYVFALHLFFESGSRHHIPVVFALLLPVADWIGGDGAREVAGKRLASGSAT